MSGSACDGLPCLSALKLFGKTDKVDRANVDLRKDLRFIGVMFKNNKTQEIKRFSNELYIIDKAVRVNDGLN